MLIGIDPGWNTGVAIFVSGKLHKLHTIQPVDFIALLETPGIKRVIFEDSRLQSHVWTKNISHPAALKMARNVGQIDAWCRLISEICAYRQIPCHGISPKQKGAKVDAKAFKTITGWEGQTNEHTRDAAMVAWQYRGAV